MSRTFRTRRRRQREQHARRIRLFAILVGVCIAMIVAGGYAGFREIKGDEAWPTIDNLEPGLIAQNSRVYAANGDFMGWIRSAENRQIITLKSMGDWLPKAAVATEDRRFYSHNGVDPEGIARAAIRNVEAGGSKVEGASTITQQLVRELYVEISREKTYARKVKEATLAMELEERWSKKRILETYLNLVFFGHNAYGVQAASLTYFSKQPRDLQLHEAALIAGLPQAPSEYDPINNPKDALERRAVVLTAMRDAGYIKEAQYQEAMAKPLGLNPGKVFAKRKVPYFFDFVEKQLKDQFGTKTVRNGGLTIRTTIDPYMQRTAEAVLTETLPYAEDPEAAIVVIENKTGQIKAMASTTDYASSKFNLAVQGKRQPGSSAKTWVLAAFVKAGIDPDSNSYTSQPLKVRPVGAGDWWEVKTYDNSYAGTRSIRSATVASDNSVYAQMVLDIGADEVVETAQELGIETKLKPYWSIGLGSQDVTPLEQTNVYATIARGGVYLEPTAVSRITGPGGTPVTTNARKKKRVLEDWQAATIIDILEDNVEGGTGTSARQNGPAAGKTGTTDDHVDAWFCGMTAEYTACVWMGFMDALRPMTNVHGITVAGGTFPAQMWGRFFSTIYGERPLPDFFTPVGVPSWVPFISTWKDNPLIDKEIIAPPKPAEDEKDKKKKKNGADDTKNTTAEETDTATPAEPDPGAGEGGADGGADGGAGGEPPTP